MGVLHVSQLQGKEVIAWYGTEMALAGGEQIMTEDTPETGLWTTTPIIWEHDSIPYLQLTNIDLSLAEGKTYRVLSQLEDGTDFYGIYLLDVSSIAEAKEAHEMSEIFRTGALPALPVGPLDVEVVRQDGPRAVLEVALAVGQLTVRLVSGEVYEREGGRFEIGGPDETLLVQLNGQRPNLTVHRTLLDRAAQRR